MKKDITCRELIEFLDDYAADRLERDERATFDRHLGVCRHCREFLRTYRQTIELSRSAWSDQSDEIPTAVPEEVVRAVLAARRASS